MEHFVEIVNGFQLLTIFAKVTILDVWHGSEYTFGRVKEGCVTSISFNKNKIGGKDWWKKIGANRIKDM